MEQSSRAKHRRAARPFTAGATRKSQTGCFSNYAYIPENKKGQKPRKAACDQNGAPMTVHAGNTSLRHRSTEGGAIGTCVPHGQRSMEMGKDPLVEWTPDPYSNPVVSGQFRTQNGSSSRHRGPHGVNDREGNGNRMGLVSHGCGFKLGAPEKGDYFDPTVRLMSRNYTYPVDRRMLGWVAPTRVDHVKPWNSMSIPKGTNDKSFVSGHRAFPYHYAPFDEIAQAPSLEHCKGNGFRPLRPQSAGHKPWRYSKGHQLKCPTRSTLMHARTSSMSVQGRGVR